MLFDWIRYLPPDAPRDERKSRPGSSFLSKVWLPGTYQRFYDAGNSGDMDTAFGLISDDIQWANIGSTSLSGTFWGKEELFEKLLGPLFGRLEQGIRMTVHRLVAEGDYVVAQTSGQAMTTDGRPYNNSYCWIIRIADGKFAEVTEFMDTELITSTFG
jgi:ketosteroid isomerase-like protein